MTRPTLIADLQQVVEAIAVCGVRNIGPSLWEAIEQLSADCRACGLEPGARRLDRFLLSRDELDLIDLVAWSRMLAKAWVRTAQPELPKAPEVVPSPKSTVQWVGGCTLGRRSVWIGHTTAPPQRVVQWHDGEVPVRPMGFVEPFHCQLFQQKVSASELLHQPVKVVVVGAGLIPQRAFDVATWAAAVDEVALPSSLQWVNLEVFSAHEGPKVLCEGQAVTFHSAPLWVSNLRRRAVISSKLKGLVLRGRTLQLVAVQHKGQTRFPGFDGGVFQIPRPPLSSPIYLDALEESALRVLWCSPTSSQPPQFVKANSGTSECLLALFSALELEHCQGEPLPYLRNLRLDDQQVSSSLEVLALLWLSLRYDDSKLRPSEETILSSLADCLLTDGGCRALGARLADVSGWGHVFFEE